MTCFGKDPAPDEWPVWRPVLLGVVTLFLLLGCFGTWSVMTTITGAIVAAGRIEVAQNRQIVQHPEGGVVASIHVIEGQAVEAGALLLRLDGAAVKSELAIVEGQYFEVLARQGRLEAERDDAPTIVFPAELLETAQMRVDVAGLTDGQRHLFDARKDSMAQQVAQLSKRRAQIDSQLAGIDAQSHALKLQLGLLDQELVAQQDLLTKGLAQASRVLALKREMARLQGMVGELAASNAQAHGRATEIAIEVLKLGAVRREEANTQLRELGYRALELAERRRALMEQVARLDILAPVSGVVLGLQVTTPQAVLRAADPVLYLIPQDRPLLIYAKIEPLHIDQISLGQPVHLVFSAFPARSTPELTGHITGISADTLTDPTTQISYYRAEIAPDVGEVEKLKGLTLIPGMPVEAFFRTEARTPLAFLIKPFTDYFARAFRES